MEGNDIGPDALDAAIDQRRNATPDTGMGASEKISLFYFGGILFGIVGLALAYYNWPGTEAVGYLGETKDTGNGFVTFLGLVVAAVGQILLAVAIIASGVRLGTRRD